MVNLKNKDAGGFFLVSAVCYFLANYIHFVIKAGIVGKTLDVIATLALIAGVAVMVIEKKHKIIPKINSGFFKKRAKIINENKWKK